MPLPTQLEHLRTRPSMHVQPVSFSTIVACVHGFDLGRESEFLRGFREWLRMRTPQGFNLSWDGLILHCTFPQVSAVRELLSVPESDRQAVNGLFDLLLAFLEEREALGLDCILDRHREWELSREKDGWKDPLQGQRKTGRTKR